MAEREPLLAILWDLVKDLARETAGLFLRTAKAVASSRATLFTVSAGAGAMAMPPQTAVELPLPDVAPLGMDVSVPVDEVGWACMQETAEVGYAIPRCYRSRGLVDDACVDTLLAAREAGLVVGLYHFPTTTVAPGDQVDAVYDVLPHGLGGDAYWIDLEIYEGNPSRWGAPEDNVAFVQTMVERLEARMADEPGKLRRYGVYTDARSWKEIFGDATVHEVFPGEHPPLWWPRFDQAQEVGDWSDEAFGGFSAPEIKQYDDNVTACGISHDLNWRQEAP